jgi:hypothetical protein
MYRVPAIILARSAVLDRFTNRLSIINVVDELRSPSFPVWIPDLVVVAMWSRDKQDRATFTARLEVTLDRRVLLKQDHEIDFATGLISRSIIALNGITIPATGILRFRLLVGRKRLAEYWVGVGTLETPKEQSSPSEGNGKAGVASKAIKGAVKRQAR